MPSGREGGREVVNERACFTYPMPCHRGRNSPSSLLATARPMMIRRKPKLRNRRVCLDSDSIPLPTAAAAGRYNQRQIDSYTLPPSPLFSASFAGRACGGGKFRLQLGWLSVHNFRPCFPRYALHKIRLHLLAEQLSLKEILEGILDSILNGTKS